MRSRRATINVLAWLVAFCCAGVIQAQPARQTVRLASLGTPRGELLAVSQSLPDVKTVGGRVALGALYRRSPAGGAGEWQMLARYNRPILAIASIGGDDVAVLLGTLPPQDSSDAATRPVTRSDVRLLSFPAGDSLSADIRFNPRAKPVEGTAAAPPPGVRFLDLASGLYDVDGTALRRLIALGDDGTLYERDSTGWTAVVSLPDGATPIGADLADAGEVAVAVATDGGVRVFRLIDNALEPVGTVDGDAFRLVELANRQVGGPLLYVGGAEPRIVRFREGEATGKRVEWTLSDERFADLAADAATASSPTAAAFSLGAVRVTRSLPLEEAAATSRGIDGVLAQLRVDPAALDGEGEAVEATTVAVELDDFASQRAQAITQFVLYGLLLFACVALLRQPAAAASADPLKLELLQPMLAPTRLRVIAAGIDALPLAAAAGLLVGSATLRENAAAIVVLAGFVAYILLAMIPELLSGRSLGKAIFGLEAASLRGTPASAPAVIVRNLMRPADLLFGWLIFTTPLRQRLGDLSAHTVVIRRPVDRLPEADEPPAA